MRLTSCLVLTSTLTLAACEFGVNRDLEFAAGSRAAGAQTINGRIQVGSAAVIDGDLATVNGRIEVAADASVHDLRTVNGSIRVGAGVKGRNLSGVNARLELGERVELSGSATTVNGSIVSEGSTVIQGEVATVNGDILLRGTRVGRGVSNHLGDVRLLDGTLVEGDLLLEAPDLTGSVRTSLVVIGVGAQVRGVVRAERPIELHVHPTAKLGVVQGATPIPFQGTDVERN